MSSRKPSRTPGERGVTLLEVSLMLTVSMTLLASLAPAMRDTIRHAEIAKASTLDMPNITAALNQALTDMAFVRFTNNGSNLLANQESLLVSDGDMPRECSVPTQPASCAGAAASWNRLVSNAAGSVVDFLERHLVTNNPRGLPAQDYPVGAGAWRGAYLTGPIDPDPWGNRYMVNTQYYAVVGSNVVVLSAGPDEVIQTVFNQNAVTPLGDDLLVLVQP